jgi:hypothetical protein
MSPSGILKLFGIWCSGFGISLPGLLRRRPAMTALVIVSLLMMISPAAFGGHLEPFQSVPIPEANPQTPEKIELGKKL